MNSRFAIFVPMAAVWLSSLLLVGCVTTSAPPPPGVVQVWVESQGVRVLRNGETISFIKPKYRNVEQTKLDRHRSEIVIKSRGRRGTPAVLQLFDINTGELKAEVMTFELYTGQPAWARGFQD